MMLEPLLDELAALGQMAIFRHKDGTWSASLELPAPDGVTAKVSSDFKRPTCLAALLQVKERLDGMRKAVVPGVAAMPMLRSA